MYHTRKGGQTHSGIVSLELRNLGREAAVESSDDGCLSGLSRCRLGKHL